MKVEMNTAMQRIVDAAINEGLELGMQVAVYYQGRLEGEVFGGIANPSTGKKVDAKTLFCPFSVTKGV